MLHHVTGVDVGEGLRRRMLLSYLAVLAIFYCAAVAFSTSSPAVILQARGEMLAVALCAVGLLATWYRPLRGIRYLAAVICMCTAPVAAMLFHEYAVAQVWGLVPLMFAAVYIRTFHSVAVTRVATGLIALAAVAGLLGAPAVVPALWLFFFTVSIVGAAEVFGLVNSALLDAALRDPLTAVWNRAGVHRRATELMARARRRGHGIAVLIFDVDDFKHINDRDGHAAGDLVLSHLTSSWAARLPASAVIGRLGGDEFIVVLTGYDLDGARLLADQLTADLVVPVSVGVAAGAAIAENFTDLLAAADDDLYIRKRRRRDGLDLTNC
jgi:diguanylate cyclase (GGDEF)-like protein